VRPTQKTYLRVVERDAGCCAVCAGEVWGQRGFDFSLHHRRPAKAGGDRRPESHLPGNLVLLHGSGTTGCHWLVEEKHRAKAYDTGLLVREPYLPSLRPIEHAVHGLVWLADDGSYSDEAPEEAA
jgi:hypothetical protein